MKVHLSHGSACALMLPYVMDFNLIGNLDRYARSGTNGRVYGRTITKRES